MEKLRKEQNRLMPNKSNLKGKTGECEISKLLQEHLGLAISRNLNQSRDGGHDLTGIPGIALEVKRSAKPLITTWWKQTCRQASATHRVPVLAYRLDRKPWTFKMALRDLMEGFNEQPRNLELTVELPVEAFCAVVREQFCN